MNVALVREQWHGCCEHGDKSSGSLKGGEFIDQLSDYWLDKGSAPSVSTTKCPST